VRGESARGTRARTLVPWLGTQARTCRDREAIRAQQERVVPPARPIRATLRIF